MKKIKHFFKYIEYFFFSRYFFVIVLVIFTAWILFFDKNNVMKQQQTAKENNEIRTNTANIKRFIAEKQYQIKALSDSLAYTEKYAREHYQMRKDGETVFLFDN